MDKYIVVSQQEWEQSGSDPGFLHKCSVLNMADASKAANGLSASWQMPYYVVKMVPVSLHKVTILHSVEHL